MVRHSIAGALLAAAFCVGVAQAQGTLRVGLQSEIDTLDPVLSNTIAGRVVFHALCDKLVDVDENLNFVPQLATRWEWSADRRTLTMQLRDGVVFHDGAAFDAEAVKFNLERALTLPGSRRRSEIVSIERVVPVDRLTVRIELRAPFGPLLAQFVDRAGMMVSPRAAAEAGADFSRRPVCSGPFEFVERIAQDRIVFRRFERYWDRARVQLDAVVFRPMPDATVRLLNLRAGGLEIIERVAASDVASVRRDQRLRFVEATGLGFTSIIVNVGNGEASRNPLGQDARVREAFDLTLDRVTINRVAFEGANRAGNQPVPPGTPFYAESHPLRGRDVARARQLLQEAGQPNLEVRLLVPNTTEFLAVAEIIQAMARDAGITMRIDAAELATAAQMMNDGRFQAFLIGWSGRVDPDGNIYAFNHCAGTNNDSKFCDPRVNAALDRARAAVDVGERRAAYDEAAAIHLPARHRIYLYHENWRFALSARVQGFRAIPDGVIRFQGLRIE